MADIDRSIANLGDKIDELAVQIGSLTDTVTRVERTIEQLSQETRDMRAVIQSQAEVAQTQAENIRNKQCAIACCPKISEFRKKLGKYKNKPLIVLVMGFVVTNSGYPP